MTGTGTEGSPALPAEGGGSTATPTDHPAPPSPPARGPRRLRAFLIGSAVAAALAVFLFVGLGTSPKSQSSGPVVPVGSVAPTFTLPSLTGGAPVDLEALGPARHRPVVLNFFASWCPDCRSETPMLAQAAAAGQASGSTVQFVGVDTNDPPSAAIPFVEKAGITYPVAVDSSLEVTSVRYGLYGDPQTFFIGADGRVEGHVEGALRRSVLEGWLHRLGGSAG
ncbi:MAG: TlpA disulfide reductase family protein [Acidimicrobiales bacterium]|jgi:cytochrome c biogenesis protein CcmG/thiol:disulfide interchange protein DsbE